MDLRPGPDVTDLALDEDCGIDALGSAEMSKTIGSNPASAASIALVSECVWSALRKIGTSNSLRRLWITAAI
jgi:hypothetical protein